MLLKLSAAYAMFVELFVIAIMLYLELSTTEIVILGLMSYAALFFFAVLLFSLCQVGSRYD